MSQVRSTHRVDQGYTLGTLFLLIAACAAVLALVTPLIRSRVGEDIGLSEFAVSVALGGLLLGAIGVFVGLFHYARLPGALMGLLMGIALGACAGPLVLVPVEELPVILALAAGGFALIVGMAAALRRGSDGWRKSDLPVKRRRATEPKRHPLDPDPEDD